MGPWEFVGLAYGIVWAAIIIYWLSLRRRMNNAQTKLLQLKSSRKAVQHA